MGLNGLFCGEGWDWNLEAPGMEEGRIKAGATSSMSSSGGSESAEESESSSMRACWAMIGVVRVVEGSGKGRRGS